MEDQAIIESNSPIPEEMTITIELDGKSRKTMEEQLIQLEKVIERLADRVSSTQEQHQQLVDEKAKWAKERAALKARCDAACERIEALIEQLQTPTAQS